ncbi:hypothetical protein [Bifidobacterium panos]|uniref:PhnA protein n=1 Tax=Bifidobacterium panos TaxID=2675321 RepID=A0ABX1SZN8_9BIFI|nr:hypothetical protein [Bifidobacterium sp. DSM 109963]NMN02754.1 PhnA protein [Bifidobacterium sp. DSM 109963]
MAPTVCPNCWRDKTENQQICTLCESTFASDLKWLRLNIRDLEDYTEKRVGKRNGHGGGGYRASEPVRVAAFDLLYGQSDENGHQGLDITLRCFCACLGKDYSEHDTPYDLTGKIMSGPFLRNSGTPVYAKEIHRLKTKARRFLDFDDEEKEILGPCPNPECGVQLAAPVGVVEITCRHCNNKWTVGYLRDQRRARILDSGRTGTSIELQDLLAQCGIATKRSTVRGWVHHKRLTQAVDREGNPLERDGKPLYRLADMYLLATGEMRKADHTGDVNLWELVGKKNEQTRETEADHE